MTVPIKQEHGYTFADYLEWDENVRAEIIGGEVIMMATPSSRHQEISAQLSRQLANFLDGKKCGVYPAPFTVRLFEKDSDNPYHVDTVVEPDISVICNRNKIDKHGCKGAPDLIIEILSPSTQRDDRIRKLMLYQQAGVREYWIVNPADCTVQVFMLKDGYLFPNALYEKNDAAAVNVLEGCTIDLAKVFAEWAPEQRQDTDDREERSAKREKITVARNLLAMGLSVDTIAKGTGLTMEEIESIRSQKNLE